MPALPIKWHMAIFGLLVACPLVAVEAVFLRQIAQTESLRLEEGATQVAADVGGQVDKLMRSGELALQALATSLHLTAFDAEAFHAQMVRVAQEIPGVVIGLRENGAILLSSARPPGSTFGPLDPVLAAADAETIASRSAFVSNAHKGTTTGQYFVTVQVPALTSERSFVLSMSMPSRLIVETMAQKSLGANWVAAITDRNRNIVARGRENERYAGQPASASFVSKITGETGRFPGRTLDGVPVVNGYVRLPYTGWIASAAVPTATLQAPLQRTVWQVGSTLLLAWAVATTLAWLYARRLTTPLAALKATARRGVRQEPGPPLRTPVTELNILSEALSGSFEQMRQQAQQQDLLLHEFAHRLKNTLMTVQAIALLSSRKARTIAEFQTAFSDRIVALARSHDLLLQESWEPVAFSELVRSAAEAFCDEGRCRLSGSDARFEAQSCIALGLILHELFTNAGKYGALTTAKGHVEIALEQEEGAYLLHWRERGGPPFVETPHQGFGTVLIAAMLRQIRGAMVRTATKDGLLIELRLMRPETPAAAVSRREPPEPVGQPMLQARPAAA
jgi:two-component sensor histidine kinase